eukprot:GFKZ01002340.1.p1 GENE.GFKZ01002340.1~~GFKZ01002340.1.p1  ORF type:complete len:1175 (+),score=141.21 GFKZ01002340.1:344-3868(+)
MSSDKTPDQPAQLLPSSSDPPPPPTTSPPQQTTSARRRSPPPLSARRRSPPPTSAQPVLKCRRLPPSLDSRHDDNSEYTNRSASPDPHDTARPKKPKSRGDVRRVWSRRALETSGISPALLHALDDFTSSAPPIPKTMDLSRNIPIRNMRKWIADLEAPVNNPTWTRLVQALRADHSAQRIWGNRWDHDVCRFILGVLVPEDHSKNTTDKKQSRQAVNNAIKRELTCPAESRTSSRSKTFRDLFREKCNAAGVPVPQLSETQRRPTRPPQTPKFIRPAEPDTMMPTINVAWTRPPPEEPFVMSEPIRLLPVTTGRQGYNKLEEYREKCIPVDDWGRTEWWRLSSEDAMRNLPKLLAEHSLWELRSMLLDFRWIMQTFRYVDFSQGMRQLPTLGYDELLSVMRHDKRRRFQPVEVEGFRLIRNALMLIVPILARDKIDDPTERGFLAHLATQLVGRLLNLKRRFAVIAELIQSIQLHAPKPWLRPLTPCFQEPSTDIKIAVPSYGTFTPHLIDLSHDGRLLAISGTEKLDISKVPTTVKTEASVNTKNPVQLPAGAVKKNSSIRVWDVESGKLVWVVDNISSFVRCLALAWDCSCVVGETVDGLFFWRLEKEDKDYLTPARIDATPRPKSVTSITPTVQGQYVLTTSRSSDEPAISLWDTSNGQLKRVFSAVVSRATCVDVCMDNEYFASGHKNGFIHLWNLWSEGIGGDEPVLSFKNEGNEPENGQQHVALGKTNSTADDPKTATVSISFLDTGGDSSWLAAAAADGVIRVWLLPPTSITRNSITFVSSLRRAVIQCPHVREVQWSLTGGFFSSGDDGIVRLWRKRKTGRWESHAIGKDKHEHQSTLSTVFVSSGKKSELVATYVTKSPYVTVWDTYAFQGEDECEIRERAKLYRSYFCVVKDSVDSTDIAHLTTLERVSGRGDTISTTANGSASQEAQKRARRDYAMWDSLSFIRTELEWYFSRLGLKYATKKSGEMNPRLLTTIPTGTMNAQLEICFEQPVIHGVSGTFKTATMAKTNVNSKIAQTFASAYMQQGTGEVGLEQEEEETYGTVVALLNGEIGIFELHDIMEHDGAMSPKSMSITGQGKGLEQGLDHSTGGGSEGHQEGSNEKNKNAGGGEGGGATMSVGGSRLDDGPRRSGGAGNVETANAGGGKGGSVTRAALGEWQASARQ